MCNAFLPLHVLCELFYKVDVGLVILVFVINVKSIEYFSVTTRRTLFVRVCQIFRLQSGISRIVDTNNASCLRYCLPN